MALSPELHGFAPRSVSRTPAQPVESCLRSRDHFLILSQRAYRCEIEPPPTSDRTAQIYLSQTTEPGLVDTGTKNGSNHKEPNELAHRQVLQPLLVGADLEDALHGRRGQPGAEVPLKLG